MPAVPAPMSQLPPAPFPRRDWSRRPAVELVRTRSEGSPAAARPPLDRDELALLAIVATGLPLTSVARRLGISDRTVRRRLHEVCTNLDVRTSIEAVAWAARRRLI